MDTVTLEEQLTQAGTLAAVGGLSSLSDLVLAVPTADNIVHYADIVRDKARARRLITVASEIAARGFGEYGDVQEFLDAAESEVFEVTHSIEAGGPRPVNEILKQDIQDSDTLETSVERLNGLN